MLRSIRFSALLSTVFAALILFAGSAMADGIPQPWQLNFQPPASPVMEQIENFHNILLVIITIITLFVLLLLGYVCWRFRAKANPTPSKTTHNTLIEIIWTAIPVLILVLICIPSIRLLYFSDKTHTPELTLKVIGYQWYWGYVYPDNGDLAFESYLVKDADLKPDQKHMRLLEVDKEVVLPVDTDVRILLTAADVIHAWAVPALGVKKDAVPGRINETWVRITKPGIYYGQCSELCGQGHGFMPIKVRAVSKEEFADWVVKSGGKMPAPAAAAPQAKAPTAAEANAIAPAAGEEIVMPNAIKQPAELPEPTHN